MTIILRDGNRQTFNSADVVRIEFQKSQVSSEPQAKYKAVLVPGGITWEEANGAARAMGGHLAVIRSAAENEYVYSLIANDDRFWYMGGGSGWGPWLGGYQPPGSPEPAGGWRWVTNDPFSYNNWAPGEPNNYDGEDRIHFFGLGTLKSPKWNDVKQNWKMKGYIVEF
jgi:hypothetical protein